MPRKNTVCRNCQSRHLKCIRDEHAGPCRRCHDHRLLCENSSLRVRNVATVPRRREPGKRTHLDYAKDQVWVPVPTSLQFASRSPAKHGSTLSEDETIDSELESVERESSQDQPHETQSFLSPTVTWSSSSIVHPNDSPQSRTTLPSIQDITLPLTTSTFGDQFQCQQDQALPVSTIQHELHSPFGSTTSPVSTSRHTASAASPAIHSTPWTFEDANEARLFSYFVQRLAPWLDSFDSKCHFSKEVPRRAAFVPVIMMAILASAARHMAFVSASEDTISEKYHNKCLQILIPVLSEPCDGLDENICVAIIILRQYEEYDKTDERCHLFGSTRMVNSIRPTEKPSQLREAANWVALRQELHISLTNKQPVSITLEAYRHSRHFTSETEDAWANRIVFLFAKVLNYAFRDEDTVPEESWFQLQDQVEAWNASKPPYFDPLWADNTDHAGSSFPYIPMLGSPQTNAMQHYYLSKILLAAYDPGLLKLGFDAQRRRRESDRIVLHNLRIVIGLANSNPHIECTFMHASHILIACGGYVSGPEEQNLIVEFLSGIEERGIWRTSSTITRLREQWE